MENIKVHSFGLVYFQDGHQKKAAIFKKTGSSISFEPLLVFDKSFEQLLNSSSITSGSCSGSSTRLQGWFVVSRTRRSNHITLVLARLHRLSITTWIIFKIARLTFKAITTKKPEYLAEMLDFQATPRDTSIVLEKPSAREHCQDCFCQSRFPPCRSLNLEQSPNLSLTQESSKNSLKLTCTINPTVTDSPPVRACDSVLSYITICIDWHMARYQLCIIIIIIISWFYRNQAASLEL